MSNKSVETATACIMNSEVTRYAGWSEQQVQKQAARKERIQDFFQQLMDEGARIEGPVDVKQWLTKVDLAMRAFLPLDEMETFWNFFLKTELLTLDDRGCVLKLAQGDASKTLGRLRTAARSSGACHHRPRRLVASIETTR
jgi:hypothetical protein